MPTGSRSESLYRFFILGAGFSRAAGLPLAKELWREILEIAPLLDGRAGKFSDDIKTYLEYLRDCDGEVRRVEDIDFERFMQFLDIEHHLRLRGGDTWSKEGNEGTVVTKVLIGDILSSRLARLDAIPKLYLEFARRLRPDDFVVTFNYDTLLESALDAVGTPYRLYPFRYKSVDEYAGTVDNDIAEVVVLKMHGSIDWFDRVGFERLQSEFQRRGVKIPPTDIVFSHEEELGVSPLTHGPRPVDDPLRTLYRVANLRSLYAKGITFRATPRMLPPSAAKIVYANQIGDFWAGMNADGAYSGGMAIVGFSLPPQDDYARQVIYKLVTNYQRFDWDGANRGRGQKTPLAIVDLLPDDKSKREFQARYRFVDWNRAVLKTEGFDESSLAAIFAST